MIAITFALPAESRDLIARLRDAKRTARYDVHIIEGKIDNRPVAIFHTGVGRKSCEAKIGKFLNTENLDCLISAGFAGAVREDLQVGDLFLADNFSDRKLLFDAQRILTDHKTRTAKLFTSTSIVDSIAQRNEITRVNGAAAVDMETEIIAQACAAHGIRMLSVRVISDSLRNPFPAPPDVLFEIERQRTDFRKLSSYLLKHPRFIPHLIQFRKRIVQARRSLTAALEAVIRVVDP